MIATTLTREQLLASLRQLKTLSELGDMGIVEAHVAADLAVLRYVDDAEIAEAYEAIAKWYD